MLGGGTLSSFDPVDALIQLPESNIGRVLVEALSAHVQVVFPTNDKIKLSFRATKDLNKTLCNA